MFQKLFGGSGVNIGGGQLPSWSGVTARRAGAPGEQVQAGPMGDPSMVMQQGGMGQGGDYYMQGQGGAPQFQGYGAPAQAPVYAAPAQEPVYAAPQADPNAIRAEYRGEGLPVDASVQPDYVQQSYPQQGRPTPAQIQEISAEEAWRMGFRGDLNAGDVLVVPDAPRMPQPDNRCPPTPQMPPDNRCPPVDQCPPQRPTPPQRPDPTPPRPLPNYPTNPRPSPAQVPGRPLPPSAAERIRNITAAERTAIVAADQAMWDIDNVINAFDLVRTAIKRNVYGEELANVMDTAVAAATSKNICSAAEHSTAVFVSQYIGAERGQGPVFQTAMSAINDVADLRDLICDSGQYARDTWQMLKKQGQSQPPCGCGCNGTVHRQAAQPRMRVA